MTILPIAKFDQFHIMFVLPKPNSKQMLFDPSYQILSEKTERLARKETDSKIFEINSNLEHWFLSNNACCFQNIFFNDSRRGYLVGGMMVVLNEFYEPIKKSSEFILARDFEIQTYRSHYNIPQDRFFDEFYNFISTQGFREFY